MTQNKVDIQEVLTAVRDNAPVKDVYVSWEYPGYINVEVSGKAYGLGVHTGADTGYSWDGEDGSVCGEIEDLGTATEVANAFWTQIGDNNE